MPQLLAYPLKKPLTIVLIVLAIAAVPIYFFRNAIFFQPDHWQVRISQTGSSSSPRTADLNQDGILDIVIGGGGREFAPTSYAVMAFDGNDGRLLWKVKGRNQMIGSAIFKDITGDQVPDVFIGGRSAMLYAIDGAQGRIIWEYLPGDENMDAVNDTTILNFFTPQFIPDADGDQVDDLLIAYGGFVKALPEETNRPTGYLMIISTRQGKVLARAPMPDGLETYMSPVVHDFAGNGNLSVLFGTGAETISGCLYQVSLSDLFRNELSGAMVLDSGQGKGFIAPPVLADVNQDGMHDIVANAVNGRMVCIDGASHRKLWEFSAGTGYETYTMPAPGHFRNHDQVPDFFANFGYGVWPRTTFALNILIDGRNGSLIMEDTLGTFQYASPVIFDFTRDGLEDALVAVNLPLSDVTKEYGNQMKIFNLKDSLRLTFDQEKLGSNLGATPLLTDLDHDGKLDIIYCYMGDPASFYSFKELRIERIELDIPLTTPIRWGSYVGADLSGVYP